MNRGEGIWHGKPLAVEFAFECLDDVEDVSFGVGFCNRDGGRIITFDSDLPGARWKMKRGQIGTAHLCVPELLLEPDFYTIDYRSRSGDNAALEYFPQCAQVTELFPVTRLRPSLPCGNRVAAACDFRRNGI